MTTNYIKLRGAKRPEEFFPFGRTGFDAAYAAARAAQPEGRLAVFKRESWMPKDLHCVWHAAAEQTGETRTHRQYECMDCGHKWHGEKLWVRGEAA